MIITYKPDDPDEWVWMMEERTDKGTRVWWRAWLICDGVVQDYATREDASEAYWR